MPDLDLGLYLDSFERQTRLAPGLLALLPAITLLVDLGLKDAAVVTVPLGIIALAGGPVLLAEVVRRGGRRAQNDVFALWGGPITTLRLRLREPTDNVARRGKWRAAVQRATGIGLLDEPAERANPEAADGQIESAVDDLRDLLRDDTKYPLVKKELGAYCFRRNVRGIRWRGLAVSLVCAAGAGINLAVASSRGTQRAGDVVTIGLGLAVALVWLACGSVAAMRSAADDYSFQLLQGAVALARSSSDLAGAEASAD